MARVLKVSFYKRRSRCICFLGCYSRLPQIWCFKTTEIYFCTYLGARSQSQGVRRAALLLETVGENASWLLSAFCGCWPSLASLSCGHISNLCNPFYIAMLSSVCVKFPFAFLYKDPCHWALGPSK